MTAWNNSLCRAAGTWAELEVKILCASTKRVFPLHFLNDRKPVRMILCNLGKTALNSGLPLETRQTIFLTYEGIKSLFYRFCVRCWQSSLLLVLFWGFFSHVWLLFA